MATEKKVTAELQISNSITLTVSKFISNPFKDFAYWDRGFTAMSSTFKLVAFADESHLKSSTKEFCLQNV